MVTRGALTGLLASCAHTGARARVRACACALPSSSDASDVAFASTTAAPHCAASFEFSAVSAEFRVASAVFSATSFSFRAVSAPIVAACLRRARHDSCCGAWNVVRHVARRVVSALFARHAARTRGYRRTLREAPPSALGGRPGPRKPSPASSAAGATPVAARARAVVRKRESA